MSFVRILFLVLLALTSVINTAYAKKPIVCDSTYALCNAASCQAIPGMPKKALCSCSVWQGKNIGFSNCADRKEKIVREQINLVSTFSFGGGHYQYMSCPSNSPWTSCLDKPCFIDKQSTDGRKAVCTCDIVRNKAFVTFAGECNTDNCSKAVWSGATIEGNEQLMQALSKATGEDTSNTMCPSTVKSEEPN